MSADSSEDSADLGFSYRRRKNGDIEVLHHGRIAATLRGRNAEDLLSEAPDPASPDAQRLMARLTGNYKRGNERLAGQHPRNRKQAKAVRRVLLLILCLAVGCGVGLIGHLLSGSQWWYLAIPGAVAAAWLVVANPERCVVGNGQSRGGSGSAA